MTKYKQQFLLPSVFGMPRTSHIGTTYSVNVTSKAYLKIQENQ